MRKSIWGSDHGAAKLRVGLGGFIGLAMMTSCAGPGESAGRVEDGLRVKAPVRMRAEVAREIEVRAYFFTAPEDFGFVKERGEPAVAGTYPAEVGERLVKSLSKKKGFALLPGVPPDGVVKRGPEGELKLARDFLYAGEYNAPELVKDEEGKVESAIEGLRAAEPPDTRDFTAWKDDGGKVPGRHFVALIQVRAGGGEPRW